jgi:hypothetical protein
MVAPKTTFPWESVRLPDKSAAATARLPIAIVRHKATTTHLEHRPGSFINEPLCRAAVMID